LKDAEKKNIGMVTTLYPVSKKIEIFFFSFFVYNTNWQAMSLHTFYYQPSCALCSTFLQLLAAQPFPADLNLVDVTQYQTHSITRPEFLKVVPSVVDARGMFWQGPACLTWYQGIFPNEVPPPASTAPLAAKREQLLQRPTRYPDSELIEEHPQPMVMETRDVDGFEAPQQGTVGKTKKASFLAAFGVSADEAESLAANSDLPEHVELNSSNRGRAQASFAATTPQMGLLPLKVNNSRR